MGHHAASVVAVLDPVHRGAVKLSGDACGTAARMVGGDTAIIGATVDPGAVGQEAGDTGHLTAALGVDHDIAIAVLIDRVVGRARKTAHIPAAVDHTAGHGQIPDRTAADHTEQAHIVVGRHDVQVPDLISVAVEGTGEPIGGGVVVIGNGVVTADRGEGHQHQIDVADHPERHTGKAVGRPALTGQPVQMPGGGKEIGAIHQRRPETVRPRVSPVASSTVLVSGRVVVPP